MNAPTRRPFAAFRALTKAAATVAMAAMAAGGLFVTAVPAGAASGVARLPTPAPTPGPPGTPGTPGRVTPAVTAAGTTTTTTATPPTPPTTPPHGGGGPNPTGSTTSTSVPGSTTLPAPTTTVAPQVVDALLHAVQGDLAQLDAITGYAQDRGLVSVDQTNATSADSDADHAGATLAAAVAAEGNTRADVDHAVHRLSGVAMALYVRSDVGVTTSIGPSATVNRTVLLDMLVTHGTDEVAAARRQLKADQALLKQAQQRFAASRAAQAVAHVALSHSQSLLADAKLAAAGRAVQPSLGTPVPTIAGPSALSAGELAGWYATKGFSANITVPMADLASDYIAVGATEGLRGDIAFAQSVIETGYFTFPSGGQLLGTDNNYAGIGACDSCAHGWHFPDARTGVAAQLQLLHAYETNKAIKTPLVGRVSVAGCCPTWLALGGVWATAPDYGYAILSVYKQMLDWAVPQRLAAAGL